MQPQTQTSPWASSSGQANYCRTPNRSPRVVSQFPPKTLSDTAMCLLFRQLGRSFRAAAAAANSAANLAGPRELTYLHGSAGFVHRISDHQFSGRIQVLRPDANVA